MKLILGISTALAALATTASAATFYTIAGVTSDTSATDLFPASRLIEGAGVGFDAAEPHDRTSTLTWVTNAPNGGAGDYFSPTPNPAPRLVFDLGGSVALDEISMWGYADTNANGMISADLRFSDTLTFTGTPLTISGITQLVTPRQSFSFPAVTARYVEVVPTDNFFGINPPGGDRVGMGEIAFAVPIPEPSAMLLSLFGLGALALRRRR